MAEVTPVQVFPISGILPVYPRDFPYFKCSLVQPYSQPPSPADEIIIRELREGYYACTSGQQTRIDNIRRVVGHGPEARDVYYPGRRPAKPAEPEMYQEIFLSLYGKSFK